MIGDALGGNLIFTSLPGNNGFGGFASGGSLNVTGRVNLTENFSPMPRDRVFFDYNDFQDVPLVAGTVVSDLNRYTPGFEKTFFDRWASIEVRLPVAQTLNTTISGTSPNDTHHGEFGDLFLSFKTLLLQTETFALSGGMALTVPTANNITLVDFPSVSLSQLQIQNRAVYFQPYLAYLWTPNERFYMQTLVTTEVASGGSPVNVQFSGAAAMNLGDLRVFGSHRWRGSGVPHGVRPDPWLGRRRRFRGRSAHHDGRAWVGGRIRPSAAAVSRSDGRPRNALRLRPVGLHR